GAVRDVQSDGVGERLVARTLSLKSPTGDDECRDPEKDGDRDHRAAAHAHGQAPESCCRTKTVCHERWANSRPQRASKGAERAVTSASAPRRSGRGRRGRCGRSHVLKGAGSTPESAWTRSPHSRNSLR